MNIPKKNKKIIFLSLFVFAMGFFLLNIHSVKAEEIISSIKLMPGISSPSVKNGESLKITALAKSNYPIINAKAEISDLNETINLQLISGDNKTGIWSFDWTAHSLEEKEYTITLTFTDTQGYKYIDSSLKFTDPTFGNTVAGSSTYADGGMKNVASLTSPNGTAVFRSGVIDNTGTYAFFGTRGDLARIVRVKLSDFTFVDYLDLETGTESNIRGAVIDTTTNIAYFCTSTSPGKVIKINLNTFTKVGTLTLNSGENSLTSAAIDIANGYAYFGTNTSTGIVVKVRLSDFTRVDALTLNSGEDYLLSSLIDTVNGYAYFGCKVSPGIVVKVRLSDFTRIGAVTFNSGENNIFGGEIDIANGFAYFMTNLSPTKIIKVDINPNNTFARISALTLSSGENAPRSSVIDTTNGFLYVSTTTSPAKIVKIQLSDFTRVGVITLNTGETTTYVSNVIDISNGYLYFGTESTPSSIIKIQLSDFTITSRLTFSDVIEDSVRAVAIDTVNGFGYFATSNSPFILVKVRLSDFTRVGALTLNSGENYARCIVLDTTNGFAYLGTYTSPGIVIKIQLSDFTRVGAITLESGENSLWSAVIDVPNQFAYFSTHLGNKIIKIDLSTFTRVGAVSSTLSTLISGDIDTTNGFAYFCSWSAPGRITKINLNTFSEVGYLTLNTGEDKLWACKVDTTNGFLYASTETTPGYVVKVNLNVNASDPPTRVGAITLETDDRYCEISSIDVSGGYLYLANYSSSTTPFRLIKIRLSDFTRINYLNINNYGTGSNASYDGSGIDLVNGFLYVGNGKSPMTIFKISYSPKGYIKATKITLPETATAVTSFKIYSHTNKGNFRIGLYDSNKALVWQSGNIANTSTLSWQTVYVSSGTPTTLSNLASGTYYLSYQTDSGDDVMSYTQGTTGDGFELINAYGSFPTTISGETSTDETWSLYGTYLMTPISKSSITLIEGGISETYTVVLDSQPTDDVTITISPDSQITTIPSSLTFTNANWNVAQTITVTGIEDGIREGNHTGAITHTASSSDLDFNNININSITVNIADLKSNSYSQYIPPAPKVNIIITPNKEEKKSISFTKTLRFGSRGNEVKELQTYLTQKHYLNDVIDGIFGPKTKSAVKKFQKEKGLKIDGIFGSKSRGVVLK